MQAVDDHAHTVAVAPKEILPQLIDDYVSGILVSGLPADVQILVVIENQTSFVFVAGMPGRAHCVKSDAGVADCQAGSSRSRRA